MPGPGLAAAGDRGRVPDRPADGDDLRRGDHDQVRQERRSTRSTARPTSRSTTATSCPGCCRPSAQNKWAGRRGDGPRVRPRAAGPDRHLDLGQLPWARTPATRPTDLQYTRRLETQADCFSGMFVRVGVALARRPAGRRRRHPGHLRGDRRRHAVRQDPQVVGNHGLARSRKYWGNLGLGTSAVGTVQHLRRSAESRSAELSSGSSQARSSVEQSSAVAMAAMPSPRPVSPRPSVVVADRRHRAPTDGLAQRRARPRRGAGRAWAGCRSAGRPRCRSRSRPRGPGAAVSVRKATPGAPDQRGSDVP